MRIAPGDLDDLGVWAMVEAHQTRAIAETARGSAHALDVDALRRPDIAFWTIWDADALAGIGALRHLAGGNGELKSMYTAGLSGAGLCAGDPAAPDRSSASSGAREGEPGNRKLGVFPSSTHALRGGGVRDKWPVPRLSFGPQQCLHDNEAFHPVMEA